MRVSRRKSAGVLGLAVATLLTFGYAQPVAVFEA
jgi:hypothetical protein